MIAPLQRDIVIGTRQECSNERLSSFGRKVNELTLLAVSRTISLALVVASAAARELLTATNGHPLLALLAAILSITLRLTLWTKLSVSRDMDFVTLAGSLDARELGTYLPEDDCMKLKFYGTRGSIPLSYAGFQQFGDNPPCLLTTSPNTTPTALPATRPRLQHTHTDLP